MPISAHGESRKGGDQQEWLNDKNIGSFRIGPIFIFLIKYLTNTLKG